jgi:hypothetical protein
MWERVYELLRDADLGKIVAHFPGYPYPNLLAALEVSVDVLDSITRERYLALAVLLEDMSIVPTIQQCLWKVGRAEATATAARLVDLSLAQWYNPEGSIKLHDLQLDYVRAQSTDRDALSLIHEAVRYSAVVISKDPSQFVSQLVGRLLPFEAQPGIRNFLVRVR